GGAGRFRGGDGVVREIRVLEDCRLSLLTERRRNAPSGAGGGEPGARGRNLLNGEELPPKVTRALRAADLLRIETPGGGGCGPARPARARAAHAVARTARRAARTPGRPARLRGPPPGERPLPGAAGGLAGQRAAAALGGGRRPPRGDGDLPRCALVRRHQLH